MRTNLEVLRHLSGALLTFASVILVMRSPALKYPLLVGSAVVPLGTKFLSLFLSNYSYTEPPIVPIRTIWSVTTGMR